ncbi:MAG TPA: hypothetical protein VLC09_12035 [Polyangiaceae bacterium]|nr:hypothetical protein [Polyangiaceae bacterium]
MDASKMKYVYVITGKGERKFWHKVGVAFVNRDGSLNCKLDSLPVDGELHIRDVPAREDGKDETAPKLAAVGS